MNAKQIVTTIQAPDGVFSKAELILFVENMTQEEFNQFCAEFISKPESQINSVH